MAKINLPGATTIPLDRLVASDANVRRIAAGGNIEELAADIARRGLLQSLNVRPVLDEAGQETGRYAVVAGGRRLAALHLLVRTKRLAKAAPVPCILVAAGAPAEEDSLAENTAREALHPLDQFRAFQALLDTHGIGKEEIAARFFVTPAVVRQRLRLAAVSPMLLGLYAAGEMRLEQVMAFTVTRDHARQEEVWAALQRTQSREPYAIRRMLTEGAVRPGDKRALFVGLAAYEAAGGLVERDLFQEDGGGYLSDTALLDRLAREALDVAVTEVRTEGWLWVEANIELPYGHAVGLRRIEGEIVPPGETELAQRATLQAEYDALEAEHAGAPETPETVDARLGEIETMLARIDDRPRRFDPNEVARAGAFVSVGYDGSLRIERGFVRPQNEPPQNETVTTGTEAIADAAETAELPNDSDEPGSDRASTTAIDPDEEIGTTKIPDRLLTELSAVRTLGLRAALADDPATARLAVLHAMALTVFYTDRAGSCLEIEARMTPLAGFASGLGDLDAGRALDEHHARWAERLPRRSSELWDLVVALAPADRDALFAYCAASTLNAVVQPWDRRPAALAHAGDLATRLRLDMSAAGWRPTVETYLGRVTKAAILEAVREARGEEAVCPLVSLRKVEMAREAEQLLDGTGWLPEALRTSAPEPDMIADAAMAERSDQPEAHAFAVAAE